MQPNPPNHPVPAGLPLFTAKAARGAGYRYRAHAWSAWLSAAVLVVMVTGNPFYLLMLALAVGLACTAPAAHSPAVRGWAVFLRLGLVLALFSVGFNLLFVRAGATHLFTLPELVWTVNTAHGQLALIQLGGRVSLESLVYGLNTGLALMLLLLSFATFNARVNHYDLLRSMPRFLYQSAVVMSIAVTFIPQMFTAQREIREAQALRGHRFRKLRDLLPLFVALLAEGLERSLTLAESMEARGFSAPAPAGLLLKSLMAAALLLLSAGALAWSYLDAGITGGAMAGLGLVGLAAVIRQIGRRVQRSRYRRNRWGRADTLLVAASALVGGVMLATWLARPDALGYYPYPKIYWPGFNPAIGLTLLLMAAPALAGRLTGESDDD